MSPIRYIRFACAAALLLCASPASAAILSADFGDVTGVGSDLAGKGGGSGWSGNWTGTATIDLQSGNLNYANYGIVQSGLAQHASGFNAGVRQLFRGPTSPLTGEVWFSFLGENPVDASTIGLSFNSPDTSTPFATRGDAFVQFTGTNLVYQFGHGSDQTVGSSIALGDTNLVLGQIVINGGGAADTLNLWVNPDLIADNDINNHTPVLSLSLLDALDSLTHIGLISYSNGTNGTGGRFDALRISNNATAYQDVTGVPEPGTWAMLGLVGLALGWRARRKKG